MKYESINRKFTETVAGWITKGYVVNTSTMGGSQGEIAKVDLTDGKEVIRVLLTSFGRPCDRIGERCYYFDGVTLTVGRVTDKVTPNGCDTWDTVWNQHLDILSSEQFYEIGKHRGGTVRWYGTREEAIAQQDKASARYVAQRVEKSHDLTEKGRKIVLPFVRRQPQCKSVRLSEIEEVTRNDCVNRAGRQFTQYVVLARGHSYKLK